MEWRLFEWGSFGILGSNGNCLDNFHHEAFYGDSERGTSWTNMKRKAMSSDEGMPMAWNWG